MNAGTLVPRRGQTTCGCRDRLFMSFLVWLLGNEKYMFLITEPSLPPKVVFYDKFTTIHGARPQVHTILQTAGQYNDSSHVKIEFCHLS